MSSPASQIKERLPIEEVVSSYIKLDKAGRNLKAKCPFHNEKTPSFFVSPERGGYYCFGCGAKGDIFTFVEEFEGLDFKGALKMLADRAGISLPAFDPKKEGEKERLFQAMAEATHYFKSRLAENAEAGRYLIERGVSEKSIEEFRLGYAPSSWRELLLHMQGNFTETELEKAGLIKKGEDGRNYDRFRGRIMFPISDSSGRVIAFTGRIFPESASESVTAGKYLNSPETPIFSKSLVLYGLDRAKESIRKNNFSVLVEGQMDLILSHQAGFRNTVATSGTALSDTEFSKGSVISNLGLIRRLSRNIVLAFDTDRAGFEASFRAAKVALSLGMDVKVAHMPEGIDPAELISKSGGDAWRSAIRESKHIVEFVLEKVLRGSKDGRAAGQGIRERVLPFVDALESSIEKAHFLKKISEVSGIKESALEEDLRRVEADTRGRGEAGATDKKEGMEIERKEHILRRLLGIVLWQGTLEDPVLDSTLLLGEVAGVVGLQPEELKTGVAERSEELVFEAEVFYSQGENLLDEIKELLINLKEEHLREVLARKMRELYLAEEDKNVTLANSILLECQTISGEIEEIKNNRLKKYAEKK